MKIQILADYIGCIKDEKAMRKNFIVLVSLDEGDAIQTEWEGSVNMIRSTIRRTQDTILKEVKTKNDSIVELVQN